MKKIVLVILLHCTITTFTLAQWVSQNSGTSSFLRDVEFLNRNTGWMVGDGGVIVKTTNAGQNWISIANPAVGKPLFSIHIVDSNVCYVVGWFETIIKTTDAGDSWIVIRNGSFGFGSSYEAVFFADENTGWIAGTGQKILRTTNGGDSIITTPVFVGNLHDMYFKDNLNGIVVGSGLDVFKTNDGGLNWYNIQLPIGFIIPTFYKISIVKNQYGWLAGSDNRIFKTSNFGDSWDTVSTIPLNPQSVSMRFAEFSDEQTGFVGGYMGYLYKSINGGLLWTRENSGIFPPAQMMSMHLYNDSIGWIVGGGGKIINTTNGGQIMVGINNNVSELKNDFRLLQNYPNPFNNQTVIEFNIEKNSEYKLEIYNLIGEKIDEILNSLLTVGNYRIKYSGDNLSSGIYIYKLSSDKFSLSKKLILLK